MKKLSQVIYDYRCGDFITRNKTTCLLSMIGNGCIAVVKIILGTVMMSIFFVISGFYTIGIGMSKVIYYHGHSLPKEEKEVIYKHYVAMGIVLLVTSIIYILYMARLFFIESTIPYTTIMGITLALISFVEVGMAIKGLVKSNKLHEPLLQGLKLINLSSGLIAMVLTQSALLSVSDISSRVVNTSNAIIGIIMGSISAVIAGYMIYHYFSLRRKACLLLNQEE